MNVWKADRLADNTRQSSNVGDLFDPRKETSNHSRSAGVSQLIEHEFLKMVVHIEYAFDL